MTRSDRVMPEIDVLNRTLPEHEESHKRHLKSDCMMAGSGLDT